MEEQGGQDHVERRVRKRDRGRQRLDQLDLRRLGRCLAARAGKNVGIRIEPHDARAGTAPLLGDRKCAGATPEVEHRVPWTHAGRVQQRVLERPLPRGDADHGIEERRQRVPAQGGEILAGPVRDRLVGS